MIIEATLIIFTLSQSPIAGLLVLGYIFFSKCKIKDLQNKLNKKQLRRSKTTAPIPFIQPKGTASFFSYKGCTIENYSDNIFHITMPDGDKLQKTFLTAQEAKREIDAVAPFLKKPAPYKIRKVHNIRYVR